MSITDNLVSYFKLDESSGNAADSVGSSNAVNTAVTYATGKVNNGAVFNGTTGVLTPPTGSFANSSFSISLWFNYTGLTTSGGQMFDVYQFPSGNRGYTLGINGSDKVSFVGYTSSGSGAFNIVSSLSYNSTTNTGWHHVVATCNGSNVFLYVDGVQVATSAVTGGISYGATIYSGIGASNYDGSPHVFFKGTLDEIGYWSRVITSGEIQNLYNSGIANQYPFLGLVLSDSVTSTESLANSGFSVTVSDSVSSSETVIASRQKIVNQSKNSATWNNTQKS